MTVLDRHSNKRIWTGKFVPKRINKCFRPAERRKEEFKRHKEEDKAFVEICQNYGFDDIDGYTRRGKVGEGTYGLVTKAVHKTSAIDVALKKIKPEAEDVGLSPTTIREIALLSELQHPYVVQLIHSIFLKGNV